MESLATSTVPTEIFIVDNASKDGTGAFLKANYPQIQLIENTHNNGFGQACNQGLAFALEQDAAFVFLLNQDVTIYPDTLQHLLTYVKQWPQVGLWSPMHLASEGNLLDDQFQKYCTNISFDQEVAIVEFVNAAAWLIPISTIQKIGGFDPIFFHTGEDVDFVNRLHFHQLQVGIVPGSKIRHHRAVRNKAYFEKAGLALASDQADLLKHLKNINHSYPYSLAKTGKVFLLQCRQLFSTSHKTKAFYQQLILGVRLLYWIFTIPFRRSADKKTGRHYLS